MELVETVDPLVEEEEEAQQSEDHRRDDAEPGAAPPEPRESQQREARERIERGDLSDRGGVDEEDVLEAVRRTRERRVAEPEREREGHVHERGYEESRVCGFSLVDSVVWLQLGHSVAGPRKKATG